MNFLYWISTGICDLLTISSLFAPLTFPGIFHSISVSLHLAEEMTFLMILPHFPGQSVIIEHFLLENSDSEPYHHRDDSIRLDNSEFDPDDEDFVWCEFSRPIAPKGIYDLDLTEKMYHFYMWGKLNNDSRYVMCVVEFNNCVFNHASTYFRPILPDYHRIKKSYSQYNVSQVEKKSIHTGVCSFNSKCSDFMKVYNDVDFDGGFHNEYFTNNNNDNNNSGSATKSLLNGSLLLLTIFVTNWNKV